MMLQALTEVLQRRRTEGWVGGGSVRDLELGRSSPDLDLVVAADAATVAREAARLLKVPCFALSERHSAYRVMGCDGHIDVAALRGKGIVDDLAERDFTVNAMAIPLSEGDTVDPFGGLLIFGKAVLLPFRIICLWMILFG
jgi:tRNA nucleotidyltransferase/poly(A) polymerase